MFPQFGQQLNLKQEKVTRSFPAEDYGSHSVLELLRLAMLPPAEIGHTGYFPNTQQHFEICSMKTQAGPWWGQMPAGLQLKPPVLLFKDQRANESSPARPCSHQRSLWVQHTQQVKEFKAASSNVTSRKTKAGTREALFTKNVLRLLAVKTWWIQQATEPQNKELPNRFRFKCVHLQSGFRKSSDKDRPHPITEWTFFLWEFWNLYLSAADKRAHSVKSTHKNGFLDESIDGEPPGSKAQRKRAIAADMLTLQPCCRL